MGKIAFFGRVSCTGGGGGGGGTVTSVGWTTSQGVSAVISNPTTTPNITITLGALTGVTSINGLVITANNGTITTGTWNGTAIGDSYITSTLTGKTYNGLTLTSLATGFSIAGGTTSKTLTINNTLQLSGTDGSTLNIGTGGTLGTAAFTDSSAYEVPLTFSTGLTRTVNTITNNLSVGVSGGQSVIGGTGVGDSLTILGTTGNGTSTVAGLVFNVGNNGATNAMNIYNSGQVLINSTTVNPTSLGILRIGQGTSTIDIGERSAGVAGIWMCQTTPSTTNFILRGSASSATFLNNPAASSNVEISFAGTTRYTFDQNSLNLTPVLTSSGSVIPFKMTVPVSTNYTASTEVNSFLWQQASSRQWATGTLTTQREILFQAPTYRFVGASTLTDAVNLGIAGAPIALTNATFTNTHGIYIGASAVNGVGGAVTNSYGITVNAQTGATNNYAAQFLGGSTVMAAGTTTYAPLTFLSGTNMTTAAAGNMEFASSQLYFTRTGTTRENVFVGVSGASAPSTTIVGAITSKYGNGIIGLTDPDSWASVVISDTTWKIPLYT